LTAAIASCASGPPPVAEKIRSDYQVAASDPGVAQHAAIQLDEAKKAVQNLEETSRRDEEAVKHNAYIARQRIEIARAAGAAGAAEAEIEEMGEQRDERRLQARRAEVDRARAKADRAEERARQLDERIEELNAEQTERGLVMTMSDVLFAFNSAKLQPGASRALGEVAELLNEFPDRRVAIEGHTDAIGSDSYNQELSRKRAEAVAAFLRSRGVSPSRLTVEGLGESMPVASNDEDAGRQANRRVEIVLAPEAAGGGMPSVGAGPL